MKNKGKKAAVTGVAAVAVLAALLGFGGLGFGGGSGTGDKVDANGKEDTAVVETAVSTRETPEISTEPEETQAPKVEIRIQGREYNYQNITYGNSDHPLEDLLKELAELPRDARIDLVVEDNATKNAVDDLERALVEAGFQDVHK